MAWATEKDIIGKKPVLIAQCDLDKCANQYGQDLTNLITAPEDFTNAAWSQIGAGIPTANTDTAPDGTTTADTLTDNDTGQFERIYEPSITITGTSTYCCSLYVKKDSTDANTRFPKLQMSFGTSTTESVSIAFDTSTGDYDLQDQTANVVDYGVKDAGDYWRAFVIASPNDTANSAAWMYVWPAAGETSIWTNSANATGSIIAWGAQLVPSSTLPDYNAVQCTATEAAGEECYNTRQTCQDQANYTIGLDPLTLNFCNQLIPGQAYRPCLQSANLAPTQINPDKGLGVRASIRLSMSDFTDNDQETDPYVDNRTYDPLSQGTFWGKLLARNRHYIGRPLKILTGYIASTGFDLADFQTRNYVIENISGPDPRGNITITAKDILKLADDKRAEAPAASTGKLTAGITAAATSLTVTSGTESDYNESEYIRISDEVILAPNANRSANVFSNLSRGQFNTVAAAHDLGDGVQACKHLNATNVVDLVEDLLVNYAGIPSSYINATDWASEESTWYGSSTITTLITKPEGVTSLINELAEQYYFQIWWDEINQEIKFKAIIPPDTSSITELTDADNLIDGSVRVKRDEEKRLSRVLFYYDPFTPIETDDPEDYKGIYVRIDADQESAALYGDQRQRVVMGRFVDSESIAVQTAGRLLSRWVNAPREVEFLVEAKDADLWTGDPVDLMTRQAQAPDGSDGSIRSQILSVEEMAKTVSGTHYKYKVLELNFTGRYGFIGPDTLVDYGSESQANKDAYAFIAPDTGFFASDNAAAYQII